MAGYTYEDLMAIQGRDPDGDEFRNSPPSEADHAAHKAWAVERFGQEAWDRYAAGEWGREAGYHDGGVWDGRDEY